MVLLSGVLSLTILYDMAVWCGVRYLPAGGIKYDGDVGCGFVPPPLPPPSNTSKKIPGYL